MPMSNTMDITIVRLFGKGPLFNRSIRGGSTVPRVPLTRTMRRGEVEAKGYIV
jgi:hypothetical protein